MGWRKKVLKILVIDKGSQKNKKNPQLFGSGGPKDPSLSKLVGTPQSQREEYKGLIETPSDYVTGEEKPEYLCRFLKFGVFLK